MDLVPWIPETGSRSPAWRRELERWLEDPFGMIHRAWGGPNIEVFEDGADVVVRAEVAGLDPNDIQVRIDDTSLTIHGEVRQEERRERDGYFHTERRYGTFHRRVPLPADVDPDRARASHRNGLLEVRAPKREGDQGNGRRLEIETN